MTGHVCPECGVQRPGCACAQAEIAAAEDFDPLRIRPYVTLDSPDEGAAYGAGGAHESGSWSASGSGDPPTAQLAAIRPYPGDAAAETFPMEAAPVGFHPGAGAAGGDHQADAGGPIGGGDPSETMPLLLRGVGDVPPAPVVARRGRKRGVLVAAVAAVAVAGTAALAAAVLGGGEETDDRAAVPEVTTSASLNLAVSEAPSPSSEAPEPTSSSPTPHRTSESPSPTPSATRTTASPSPSATTTGAAAPPATASPENPVAPPTTTPATTPSPTKTKEEPEKGLTLSLGSSGPEVRDLQRRLTEVGVYDDRADGKYDSGVQEAVWLYQSYMYIQGDPGGVYGPHTREVLERYTPYI